MNSPAIEPSSENTGAKKISLLAISFLSLFLELAFIRFINSTVQVTAYFNNFLIISAFIGLGLGSSLAERRKGLITFSPLLFLIVIGIMVFLERYGVAHDYADNVFWTGAGSQGTLPAPLVVLVVFASNLAFFIPIGNKLG